MEIANALNNEIVLLSMTTIKRIMSQEHGGDALALYGFYAYTATRQKNNSVRATDNFCMKGLGWGRTRFYRAKKILQDLDIIEVVARHKNGRLQGHYVLVKYLRENYSTTENSSVEKQQCGKTTTNANKENINANKENINTGVDTKSTGRKSKTYPPEDYERVIDEYKRLKGLEIRGDEHKPIQQAIKSMFMSKRSPDEIIQAMRWLQESDEEWTKWWTMSTVKMKIPEALANFNKKRKTQERIMNARVVFDSETGMAIVHERGQV